MEERRRKRGREGKGREGGKRASAMSHALRLQQLLFLMYIIIYMDVQKTLTFGGSSSGGNPPTILCGRKVIPPA